MAIDVYRNWRRRLAGEDVPTHADHPDPGRYKMRRGRDGPWLPVAIQMEGSAIVAAVDGKRVDPLEIWTYAAKNPVSQDAYKARMRDGRWPDEPEPARAPGPGHNSGDPDSFESMRDQVLGDIADTRAYFTKNPLRVKLDADKCENTRKRIYDAGKALDDRRKAEKKKHDDAIAEIQARYNPVLDAVRAFAAKDGFLDTLAQGWAKTESIRLQREHDARVRAEEEARAIKLRDEPVLALTDPKPAPAPPPPKVMYGTQGPRRGVQTERHTATITDLKALVLHLAEQANPELIEAVQKIANAAARSKARMTLPGVRMSWETEKQKEVEKVA